MKKTYSHLLIIAVTVFTFLTTILIAGCSSHSTDEGMVTTYTASGEYTSTISERVIEVIIEDEKVKLRVPLDLLEKSKQLVKGESVKITYTGPPNIEEIYLLESIDTED